jgi:hypothetical protein
MDVLISLAQVAVIVALACYSYVLGVRRGRRQWRDVVLPKSE